MKIYVNKIEKGITFKIKTGYCLDLVMSEVMKLLQSTKDKMTKDEKGEKYSHLEITEIVLVHCNIVNSDYQHDSRVLYTFVPYKVFVQLLDISPKNFIFQKTLKYLIFAPTSKNKETLVKCIEIWDKIKNLIEKINGASGEYKKGFMKIKFDSDENLPLGKILSFHNMTIVIRSIFQEDKKYYPQIFLDECLYQL